MTLGAILAAGDGPPQKHSFSLQGHRTSLSLEPAFWAILKLAAAGRGCSLAKLVEEIDAQRTGNLSSAVRLFAVRWLVMRAEL